MSHNYEAQRRETFQTFAEAANSVRLPKTAVVDYVFFVEELDADWTAFETALRAAGFKTEREDEETVIASFGPIAVTPEAIWVQERIATQIALKFEFYPDGWDLAE